ncbi:MAG: hypothetical protein K2N88_02850 [Muribaculaceae bacterium]|nr:hypothetical protein [Muribaculaceae bacterium]
MYLTKITVLTALLAGLPLVSCGSKHNSTDNAEAQPALHDTDSVPETIKKLVKAVNDDDGQGFANLVSYPLQRPYPLHDIDSPEEMSEYYHKLVDDSLRQVILKAGAEKWSEYGWRGWSLDDGRYLWVDDNVYDINYISSVEKRDLDSLSQLEISTIEPSIREGWRPVMCLRGESNGKIYRVDSRTTGEDYDTHHFRLAVYDASKDLSSLPSELVEGKMEVEGSAGTVIFMFGSSDTNPEYVLQPEATDSPDPVIVNTSGETIQLQRAYWHDLVKNKL